jgi:hypothetical protein
VGGGILLGSASQPAPHLFCEAQSNATGRENSALQKIFRFRVGFLFGLGYAMFRMFADVKTGMFMPGIQLVRIPAPDSPERERF